MNALVTDSMVVGMEEKDRKGKGNQLQANT